MSVWFVSRHPGAIEWANAQKIAVDQWVPHLSVYNVSPGDTVIGTLPVNMAAEVCARGARYLNLSLDLPHTWRGKELCAAELVEAGARLEEFFIVQKKGSDETEGNQKVSSRF